MKLPGYIDPSFAPPAPSIYAQITSRALTGKGAVAFLIDTGASVTILMDRDRERLGLDWNRLDGTNRTLTGIGGTVDARIIKDGTLLFRTESEQVVRERLPIHVAKHDTSSIDHHGRERVLLLPSLLGRDLVERYRLVYDKSNSLVYLER